jgi:GTP-binding protein YchF
MRIGIIGLARAGKRTVFRLLTGHDPPPAKGPGPAMGIARVPDPRLNRLASLFRPKKVTPLTLEVLNFPPLGRAGKDSDAEGSVLAELRQVDVIVHVIRHFEDARVPHEEGTVDPLRDLGLLDTLLLLADLAVIEKRIDRIADEVRKGQKAEGHQELPLLERCRGMLTKGQGLRLMAPTAAEEKSLRGYALVTLKPILLLLNIGEEKLGNSDPVWTRLQEKAAGPRTGWCRLAAKTEWELSQLPAEERQEFSQALGLETFESPSVLRRCLDLLDQVNFFTVVGEELKAWAIPRGATALEAAAAIHTDMARGFIKAEVIALGDLENAGSMAAARKQGRVRLEGKEYRVQDGDILTVRFSG